MPSHAVLAMLLAALATLGPFAIDTYLPAFPSIAEKLQATPLEVQQTLSGYMFTFAFMTLWHGALADAFGRRNIVLGSLFLFAIASLGCAGAHSIEYLWVFRVLQGMSAGAGMVIGRAIIRDLYSGAPAARLLSLVTMLFSIAPAIAPIIGGWIVKLLDWRSIFLFLFIFTSLLLFFCYKLLPETLPPEKRQPFNPSFLARSYSQILRSAHFHCFAGMIALMFGGLFLYIAAAPTFVTVHLGLGPEQFGWQFVPQVAGLFLGSLLVNRLAGYLSLQNQILLGFCILGTAVAGNVLYHSFYPAALPWSVVPLFFYTFGMSLCMPAATLLTLDLFPHIRGIVASCQSSLLTLVGAIVAATAAPALSGSPLALSLGQGVLALAAFVLWRLGKRLPSPGSTGAD